MLPLGQLTHLPEQFARNPFHPLLVKFSRSKIGSSEILFTAEAILLRYSWAWLLLMFALVLPPLEEYSGAATLVRLSTLIYPCFFIWSLTRLSGVELLQLVLEGRWTAEVLAAPLSDSELAAGFVTPVWVVIRQYLLITIFSLALYGLETRVIVFDEGSVILEDYLRWTFFNYCLIFNAAAWIVFVYIARVYAEIRLRNSLLKGLATLSMLLGGAVILGGYLLLFLRWKEAMTANGTLAILALLTAGLLIASGIGQIKLQRHFRGYLVSQLDIDPIIFDELDPRASAWQHTAVSGVGRLGASGAR